MPGFCLSLKSIEYSNVSHAETLFSYTRRKGKHSSCVFSNYNQIKRQSQCPKRTCDNKTRVYHLSPFNHQPTGVAENFLPLGWKTTMTYYQIVHLFNGFSFEPFLHLKSFAKSGRLVSGRFALQGSGKWPSSQVLHLTQVILIRLSSFFTYRREAVEKF